ncbi:MAG: acyltransferase family protein [Hyphomicrobium sp.]
MSNEVDRNFRADIQALRAIAVAAVVLFHADLPAVSGGYYGVDIFFVISGFLITGLLVRELEASNTIELLSFWKRRAWRLLPNALVVLSVCLMLATTLGPLVELRNSASDVLAALLYFANYHFALRALDYFDGSVSLSPVLHFWSLSVEEQFYFVWPLLLLFVWTSTKFGRRALAMTAIAVVVFSGAITIYWTTTSQPDAFFRTESRAWQLAVGALLALIAPKGNTPVHLRPLIFWCGCLGLVLSITGIHRGLISPQLFAVLPVASTGLILSTNNDAGRFARQLVSVPLLQWIGARSYSIYLWHWPIFLYGKALMSKDVISTALLVLTTLVVSGLAFHFVEMPLRYGRYSSRRTLKIQGLVPIRWLVGGSALVGLSALALVHGSPFIYGEQSVQLTQRILQAHGDTPRLSRPDCGQGWSNDPSINCLFGTKKPGRPLVALVGDSYAQHLFDGVDAAAKNAGWSLLVFTRASCPPVIGAVISEEKGVPDTVCREWLAAVLKRIESEKPNLVIVSTWEGAATRMASPETGQPLSRQESQEAWEQGYAAFLKRLQQAGVATAVIPSTPRGRFSDLEECLMAANTNQCALPKQQAIKYSRLSSDIAGKIEHITTLALDGRFCSENVCYSVRDGTIVYRDRNHHLTATFSRRLEPDFRQLLDATATIVLNQ